MNSETFSQASQNQDLHPNLKAALATLDINLEDALNWYRQYYQQNNIADNSQQETSLATISSQGQTSSDLNELGELSDLSDSTATQTNLQQLESTTIQDHLASSEELLRQLNYFDDVETDQSSTTESNQQNKEQTTSWHKTLLSPFGVVGMIILLVSGTALSLILGWLPWKENQSDDQAQETSSEASKQESKTQINGNSNQNDEMTENQIPTPNLTQGDFYLENNPLANPIGLVELEPADELPTSAKPTCGADYYCVVVENSTEQQIQKVKELTEGVYRRQFPKVGQVLQVAAHDTKSQAQKVVDRLEQQGISANIYPPDSK